MKYHYLTSRAKNQLNEFLETWACGMARAVTEANRHAAAVADVSGHSD